MTLFTYRHTYTHAYKHTNIQTYIHTYIHTYITYIHTFIHPYIHSYRQTNIHTSMTKQNIIYEHSYIHTYVRIYIHPYIHTYTHTCRIYHICGCHDPDQTGISSTNLFWGMKVTGINLHIYLAAPYKTSAALGQPNLEFAMTSAALRMVFKQTFSQNT